MSEYISKQALLGWAKERSGVFGYSDAMQDIKKIVELGEFDCHGIENVNPETREKIGKRVAEIRTEAAEKERDELRNRVEELEISIKRAHLSLTWSNTEARIPNAVWYLEQAVKELANEASK